MRTILPSSLVALLITLLAFTSHASAAPTATYRYTALGVIALASDGGARTSIDTVDLDARGTTSVVASAPIHLLPPCAEWWSFRCSPTAPAALLPGTVITAIHEPNGIQPGMLRLAGDGNRAVAFWR